MKALRAKKLEGIDDLNSEELQQRAMETIRLCLAYEIMYQVMDIKSPRVVWQILESRYMSKSLTNKLYLKQRLYGLKMHEGSNLEQHVNIFNQIITNLVRIDIKN